MPSEDAPTQLKRPSIASRTSSGSHRSRSPGDHLSSSYKAKPHRHVVSHGRLGARVTPQSKNLNRLTKLTPALLNDLAVPPTSPRPNQLKRNSTGLVLNRPEQAEAPMRKNHSETSLKRNRSSLQFGKLTKGGSSKNLAKLKDGRHKHGPSAELKPALKAQLNPTVRFDLADEDEKEDVWTEESASVSPTTTRSNTRSNSIILDPNTGPNTGPGLASDDMQREEEKPLDTVSRTAPQQGHVASPSPPDSPASITPPESGQRLSTRARPLEADRITSRLLSRNVSFTAGAKLSSVSATRAQDHALRRSTSSQTNLHSPASASADFHDATGLVSRFGPTSGQTSPIARHGMSQPLQPHSRSATTATTGTTSTTTLASRPKSSSGTTGAPTHNTSFSSASGALTPTYPSSGGIGSTLPSSRTQQKLWLDRASSNMEAHGAVHHAPALKRAGGRLGSAVFPSHLHLPGAAHEGGRLLQAHVGQLGRFAEHAEVEYRRVRLYQNPLAEAARRLTDAGVLVRPKAAAAAAAGAGKARAGDAARAPSSLRVGATGAAQAGLKAVPDARRAKVSFQGIKADEDGHEEEEQHAKVDGSRELCRRLWERQAIISVGAD